MGYGAGDGNEAPMMPRERSHAIAAKNEPREASPLERASGVMEKELHVLADVVDRLADRLAPLATARPPQTKTEADETPLGGSAHVVWLHSQAACIRSVRAILRELSDRLEV